jgi:hypothetical protein
MRKLRNCSTLIPLLIQTIRDKAVEISKSYEPPNRHMRR